MNTTTYLPDNKATQDRAELENQVFDIAISLNKDGNKDLLAEEIWKLSDEVLQILFDYFNWANQKYKTQIENTLWQTNKFVWAVIKWKKIEKQEEKETLVNRVAEAVYNSNWAMIIINVAIWNFLHIEELRTKLSGRSTEFLTKVEQVIASIKK